MRGLAATRANKSVLWSLKHERLKKQNNGKNNQNKTSACQDKWYEENDKWYQENEMRRNHDKYKALVMERRHETLFSSVKVQASLW